MKITGAEFMDWYANGFLDNDWYHEDDGNVRVMDEEGNFLLDPDKTYDTRDLGYLAYQGTRPVSRDEETMDLATVIRKWRKARDHEILIVTVPKNDHDRVKALLEENRIEFKSAS